MVWKAVKRRSSIDTFARMPWSRMRPAIETLDPSWIWATSGWKASEVARLYGPSAIRRTEET